MKKKELHYFEPHNYMPISVGAELLIEIADLKLRLKSELIGIEDDEFLIVKLAHHDPGGGFEDKAIEKSPVIIRYAYKGSVYGFEARVLNIISKPARLAFISYPERIEEYNVRTSQRYDCVLPAEATLGDASADLVITDIGNDGCRCVIMTSMVKDKEKLYDTLNMNSRLDLKVEFPGMAEELKLSGVVKNINKDADEILFGLSFEKMNHKAKVNFDKFIRLISAVAHPGTGH
jgi:hypothetical protein